MPAETAVGRARKARPSDTSELIRLRHLLLDDAGSYYGSADPNEHRQWEVRFTHWLNDACQSPDICVAVIEASEAVGLAACGIAIIDVRPPGPGLLNGRCRWIQSVVTDVPWRGSGYGGSIMGFLMDWFARAQVQRVMLNTTETGQQLYLRSGFRRTGEDMLVANVGR